MVERYWKWQYSYLLFIMVIFRYYKSNLFLFGITIIYKSKPFGKGGIYFLLLYIRLTILKNPLWSVLSLLVYNLFPLLHTYIKPP